MERAPLLGSWGEIGLIRGSRRISNGVQSPSLIFTIIRWTYLALGSNSPALFPNEFQQSNVVNVAPQPVYANQIVSPNSVSMRTMSEQPSAVYGSGMPQMATGASTTEAWRTDGKVRPVILTIKPCSKGVSFSLALSS